MASPSSNGSTNGTAPSQATGTSLQSDLAFLQNLLSQEADESDPADVAELLKRLEAAEGLAGGVEDRLDGIMEKLDRLLGDLD
ncbi:uncharacterized protein BXZ73DRAFT_7463, partial [Epithele typhae]|uniref:uncharacterized protein n=1 Tax=Epithele typhae TaxID=378194 RepID=UPI0020077A02